MNPFIAVAGKVVLGAVAVVATVKVVEKFKQHRKEKEQEETVEVETETGESETKAPAKSHTFLRVFQSAEGVEYDPSWENGTGYFDKAVTWRPEEHTDKTVYKSVDPEGRKILLVPTENGTYVLFERYAGEGYYAHNVPKGLVDFINNDELLDDIIKRNLETLYEL